MESFSITSAISENLPTARRVLLFSALFSLLRALLIVSSPPAAAQSAVETLRFKKTSVEAVEGEHSRIRITRSGDTSSAVEVTLTYAGSTATFPDDYSIQERAVSIPPGKRFRDIRLQIVNDNVDEDDEIFMAMLMTSIAGYTSGYQQAGRPLAAGAASAVARCSV